MTALAERMGLLPEIPASLHQAAKEDRNRFSRELNQYIKATPGAALKLPFILSKTLGPVLDSNHLAFLWGLIWSAPKEIKEAMARIGFPEGEDQAERPYQAIMDNPQGIWLGRLDPDENLNFIAHEDGRIHLRIPELMDGLKSVTPETRMRLWLRTLNSP